MSGFVFFIFFIIFINVVGSIFKSPSKPKVKSYRPKPNSDNPWNKPISTDQGQNERALFKAQAQAAGKKFAKSTAAKKIARQRQDTIDARANNRRNINDNNRNRIYNWGERAGPGFFTLTNMFVLLLLGLLALYVLSLLPSDFGSSK